MLQCKIFITSSSWPIKWNWNLKYEAAVYLSNFDLSALCRVLMMYKNYSTINFQRAFNMTPCFRTSFFFTALMRLLTKTDFVGLPDKVRTSQCASLFGIWKEISFFTNLIDKILPLVKL